MPFGDEGLEQGLALALSGGGYRATLFHAGVLWRLNELGLLPELKRVSSVSGGSITAAVFATKWDRLKFQNNIATAFKAEVVDPLIEFTSHTRDIWAVLKGLVTPRRSAGDFMASQYRKLLGDVTLQDLSESGPRFTFNATNALTGDNWRFQKPYSGDYRIGLIKDPKKNAFPLARVVAASAAFPPFLGPVKFKLDPNSFVRVSGSDLYDQVEVRTTLSCLDGGVYDNMGLETIWKRFSDLLIADAGGGVALDMGPSSFWISELVRAYDLTIKQDRDLRRRRIQTRQCSRGACIGTFHGRSRDSRRPTLCPSIRRGLKSLQTSRPACGDFPKPISAGWSIGVMD